MNETEFDRHWSESYRDLAKARAAIDPGPKSTQLDAIIAARAAAESQSVTRWSKWLAISTVCLAAATVLLVIVTAFR